MENLKRDMTSLINVAFPNKGDLDSNVRIPSSIIFKALQSTRNRIEEHFGGPIRCRYSGYEYVDNDFSTLEGIGVLEYLVDFSFSKFSIPQAIEDKEAEEIHNGGYRLVFVAESELGTPSEVCRDMLKLLDVRSDIRCLIFRRRAQKKNSTDLYKRILRVLHNHAHFVDTMNSWMFIELDIQGGNVVCSFYTLSNDGNNIVPIELQA
jgi:hypothetical protein